jgi:AraC-like DNA-binding protein
MDSLAGRLRSTRLFHEYRAAFEGATGLSLSVIDSPPCAVPKDGGAFTSAGKATAGGTGAAASLMSYRPILRGDEIVAWLQVGPFSWRSIGNPAKWENRGSLRSIDRREHRSLLRLLGVFALQLAEESEGLMAADHPDEPPFVEAARAYIEAHLNEDLALTTVAAAVHISAFYFCKRFHESTGFHFTEYVNRVRVARVKERLLNPHVHVSEAAFQAGFQSLSQFNRAFRRVVGKAPSDFRHRLHTHLPSPRVTHAA